ncbi:MAG: leucine-rich repeat domain-containing protein, partial [Clostridia bacterium]
MIRVKDTNVTTIEVAAGTLGIYLGAFRDCSSLTSITIPSSVTSIGDGAFYGCSNLASIIIPDSVTSIGYGAFRGCSSLTFQEKNNCLYLNNWLIRVKDTNVTTIEVANGTLV